MSAVEESETIAEMAGANDLAESEYDGEYVQTFADLVEAIQGPEDLELLQWKRGGNEIYDADGDGVEDNVHFTHDDLDKFYKPAVFFPAEEIHNTHHGKLPGHIQREFDKIESEPRDTYSIIYGPW